MLGEIVLRPLDADDPAVISRAFAEIGWNKPRTLYERYLAEQRAGNRVVQVAVSGGGFAGYVTLVWRSAYLPFAEAGIPEISDLNVLPGHRRHGVGSALLEAAERTAALRAGQVGLGVGLGADYGAAQRLYARRGYVPDGRGVMYRGLPVTVGSSLRVDDDATLMQTKTLSGQSASRVTQREHLEGTPSVR